MNLLDLVNQTGGNQAVQTIAQKFGLNESQASSAISALLPAVQEGISRNASRPDGFQGLERALSSGQHQRYLNDPSLLGEQESIDEGNGILGHLFGSKDVSRAVARRASSQTGLGEGILKKMLPVVATIAMGALSKQGSSGQRTGSGGLQNILSQFLDSNRDGSILDDVIGMASRFGRK